MGRLKTSLPDANTLDTLDKLLTGSTKQDQLPISSLTLRYLEALRINPDEVYSLHEIPKGNGRTRTIEAPDAHLKLIQSRILQVLNHDRMPKCVHGFARGRSAYGGLRQMVTNVAGMGDLEAVYSTDISDFFPSVKREQAREVVFNFLMRILCKWAKGPKLPEITIGKLTDVITDLCCLHGRLPQGAPTSPVLANMVGRRFDFQIQRMLPETQVYGRYADDIVIMGVESLDSKQQGIIKSILKSFGFEISVRKTKNEKDKQRYNIWGVDVFPKKVNGTETITFKLPKKLEEEWAKDIFEFINAEDLPQTTAELLQDERYMQIMGKLAHAFAVSRHGLSVKIASDALLLPPKLANAWTHLLRKFKLVLPANSTRYFRVDAAEIGYRSETGPREDVTAAVFEKRVNDFIEKNGLDKQELRKKIAASGDKIKKLIVDHPDEFADIKLSEPYFTSLIDNYNNLTGMEKNEMINELYADLIAFAQMLLNAWEKTDRDEIDEKLIELDKDEEYDSILTAELSELWQQFRKKLGADANGHKFLFWMYHISKKLSVVKEKPPRHDYFLLHGFKQ